MQNIGNMDNEMVMEVPDTPDRVPQNANGGEQIKSSTVRSSRIPSIVYNRARDNGKLSIDSVNNGRLPYEVKQTSDPVVNLDDSPSVSMNANIFRKMMADKVSSGHRPSEQVSSSNARIKLDNDTSIVVDVLASDEKVQSRNKGKMTDPVPIRKILSRNSFSNNNRHLKKKLTLHGNTSPDLGSAVYLGDGLGKGVDLSCDTKQMPEKLIPRPLQSTTSPRINGHKRLVRNGLISPSNIAKVSQAVQSHNNTSTDGNATNCEISLTQNCGVGSMSEGIDRLKGKDIIKEFTLTEHESDSNIAHRMKGKVVMEAEIEPNNSAKSKGKGVVEGSTPARDYKVGSNMIDKTKGKGVVQELIPAKENEHKTIPLSSRSSLSPMEEDNIVGDAFNHLKGVGGWRTTRNRSKKIPSTPSDDIEHPSRRKTSVDHVNNKNRIESENKMKGVSSESNHLAGRDSFSGPIEPSSSSMHRLDKKNEREIARMKLPKRQRKRSSAHSNYGECSSSAFDDSDITFLWSSGDPSDARSSSNRNTHNHGMLNTVIDIDEVSPEAIVRSPNTRRMGNDPDETARRQVEADERLARELQEQFYNEFEGVSNGEIDANIAWTLQQEENVQRASFHQRQRVDTRDPSMSHVRRQYPSRSFRSSLIRSANRARGPTSARMAQLRNGFLSQSPVLSSTERIQFPPNMDIEMRMHILEALEAAVGHNDGMAMPGNIFQVQRDFNENDYEMLLALDEHNHQSGASLDQINGLPQSTVQTDNFEEACAICLETPAIGDTIRHLPCLHKFHKDCIDPWLRRKTSCPICKSSIT